MESRRNSEVRATRTIFASVAESFSHGADISWGITKAHAAMVDRVAEVVGDRRAKIAVHHVDNHDAADEIGAALTMRLPQIESLVVTDTGPVLSIHVGGGAVGVAVHIGEE